GRFFLQPRYFTHVEEHIHGFAYQLGFDIGVMHIDDGFHGVAVGEVDVMEEAAAQERIRQFFFVVTGDQDNGPVFGHNALLGLVNKKLHFVDFQQQVVGEFDIGFVDFIDQQHHRLVGGKGLPQLALNNVVADIVDAVNAQLRVTQTGNGIVFVKALMRLGGTFDVPLNQFSAEG